MTNNPCAPTTFLHIKLQRAKLPTQGHTTVLYFVQHRRDVPDPLLFERRGPPRGSCWHECLLCLQCLCGGFVCQRTPTFIPEPRFWIFFFVFFCLKLNTLAAICVICFNHLCLLLCCGRSAFQDNLFCMLLKLPTKEGRAATVERQPSPQGQLKENDFKNVGFSQTY